MTKAKSPPRSKAAAELDHIAEPLRHLARPVAELQLDPRNAKIHDAKSLDAIRGSLQEYGQTFPILVQAEGMIVRCGNGRLTAARQLGWTKIAAAVIAGRSEQEWQALAIADNRSAELARWDEQQLSKLLDEAARTASSEEVTSMFDALADEMEKALAAAEAKAQAAAPDPELVGKQPRATAKAYRVKITCADAAQQLAILAECHKQGWTAESF